MYIISLYYLSYYCIINLSITTMCMHQSKQAREFSSKVDFSLSGDDDSCEYIDVAKRINSQEKDLRIVQMNIRGITSKVSDLIHLIDNSFHNETPDAILLCKTWLNDNSPPLSIPGYTLFNTNRNTQTWWWCSNPCCGRPAVSKAKNY